MPADAGRRMPRVRGSSGKHATQEACLTCVVATAPAKPACLGRPLLHSAGAGAEGGIRRAPGRFNTGPAPIEPRAHRGLPKRRLRPALPSARSLPARGGGQQLRLCGVSGSAPPVHSRPCALTSELLARPALAWINERAVASCAAATGWQSGGCHEQ